MVLMACLLSVVAMSVAVSAQDAPVSPVAAKEAVTGADAAADEGSAAGDESAADTVAAPSTGRDIIGALLADDEGEDLLGEDKSVAADPALPADSPKASAPADASGQSAAEPAVQPESAVAAEPPVSVEEPVMTGRRRGPPGAAHSTADAAPVYDGPAVIKDGRTINFAQNLSEYRSPRLAMLMSLLVPGLGQAYSRSYLKAGAFGAAEIAIIGVAAYLNAEGKSKKRAAHKFADANFEIDKLQAYDNRLRGVFDSLEIDDFKFFPPYDTAFYNAAARKHTYYYESIRDWQFTPGWNDHGPDLEQVLEAFAREDQEYRITDTGTDDKRVYMLRDSPDIAKEFGSFYVLTMVVDKAGRNVSVGPTLGHSDNQAKYNSMMKDANSYHDAVNFTMYALLINHIASAIDAGFTARAYNAHLLGQDNSVWNRVSVEQQYVFTGSEVSPGLAFKVRF